MSLYFDRLRRPYFAVGGIASDCYCPNSTDGQDQTVGDPGLQQVRGLYLVGSGLVWSGPIRVIAKWNLGGD